MFAADVPANLFSVRISCWGLVHLVVSFLPDLLECTVYACKLFRMSLFSRIRGSGTDSRPWAEPWSSKGPTLSTAFATASLVLLWLDSHSLRARIPVTAGSAIPLFGDWVVCTHLSSPPPQLTLRRSFFRFAMMPDREIGGRERPAAVPGGGGLTTPRGPFGSKAVR